MKRRELERLRRELEAFVKAMTQDMGRSERREALGHYITGLLLEGERKSIAPMAERLTELGDAEAMRQRMQQAVVIAKWSQSELFRRIAEQLNAKLPELEAFVIDDTGFPKKGEHSVGVARQYSGTLGRTDNCQVATSLHLAGEAGSGCIGMRLYLSQEWIDDKKRCAKAGVPKDAVFRKKWQSALELLDDALAWGLPQRIVLADSGYGDCGDLRRALDERGLSYLVAVTGTANVWPPESEPRLADHKGVGRYPARLRGDGASPLSIEQLIEGARFRRVTWRQGSRGMQSARFAVLRVRPARQKGRSPEPKQWLLIEETNQPKRPYKFYLSNLPADTSTKELVRLAKLRWRIERDYQELKGELGLDHFEGRTWSGFHHHVALCAAAHAFLAIRRAISPPIVNALDAADGTQRAPAGAAQALARVSSLPCPLRPHRSAARAIAHVIKSY
jgi:SRSO17 transposase